MNTDNKPICTGCNKTPDEIQEYIECAEEEEMSPDDYVKSEEGTYNPSNGHFLCTDCYIAAGMPSLHYPNKWIAP
jgi:hypothetical protein